MIDNKYSLFRCIQKHEWILSHKEITDKDCNFAEIMCPLCGMLWSESEDIKFTYEKIKLLNLN